MNDPEKSNDGNLVPTGHHDLVSAVSANPLVARGVADLAKMFTPIEMAGQAQELPAELVAAWEKAGAAVGWMSVFKFGFIMFRKGGEGEKSEVPAFYFSKLTAGVVAKLPQPQMAFGLCLKVTDAGLKGLAGLKRLQSLDLTDSQVTDAGLKELAGRAASRWPGLRVLPKPR